MAEEATQENSAPAEEQTPEPKTYTQEDFDRIVGKVRSEERQKFQDYDDLKKKASEYDAIAEAQKSDLEKTQERLAKKEQELAEIRERHQQAVVSSAIASVAARKGAVDPDAVVRLIERDDIEFDGEGNPANTEDLVDALLSEKPYLVGKQPTPSYDGGARTPVPEELTTDDPKMALGLGLRKALERRP